MSSKPTLEIHGFAIVSEDDRIADASGQMPRELHNEADWTYFQAELDRADWIAIGRASHEATPNAKGRRRIVLSRRARGLERRDNAWFWDPLSMAWSDVAARLLPQGGRVAVPGGQAAFDIFLQLGFTAFHLSRVGGLALPGGRGLFRACETGIPASEILRAAGLRAEPPVAIDPAAGVTLTLWKTRRRESD